MTKVDDGARGGGRRPEEGVEAPALRKSGERKGLSWRGFKRFLIAGMSLPVLVVCILVAARLYPTDLYFVASTISILYGVAVPSIAAFSFVRLRFGLVRPRGEAP